LRVEDWGFEKGLVWETNVLSVRDVEDWRWKAGLKMDEEEGEKEEASMRVGGNPSS